MKSLLTEWRKFLSEKESYRDRKEALRAVVSPFAKSISDEYEIDLWMSSGTPGDEYSKSIVNLDSIVVPKEKRGSGLGTKAMNKIIDWADENDYIIALTPSKDFGGSVPKLKKFYKGFGFKSNLGRNKDYRSREAMIRYPGGKR